jgi:hypothetical protein
MGLLVLASYSDVSVDMVVEEVVDLQFGLASAA